MSQKGAVEMAQWVKHVLYKLSAWGQIPRIHVKVLKASWSWQPANHLRMLEAKTRDPWNKLASWTSWSSCEFWMQVRYTSQYIERWCMGKEATQHQSLTSMHIWTHAHVNAHTCIHACTHHVHRHKNDKIKSSKIIFLSFCFLEYIHVPKEFSPLANQTDLQLFLQAPVCALRTATSFNLSTFLSLNQQQFQLPVTHVPIAFSIRHGCPHGHQQSQGLTETSSI